MMAAQGCLRDERNHYLELIQSIRPTKDGLTTKNEQRISQTIIRGVN